MTHFFDDSIGASSEICNLLQTVGIDFECVFSNCDRGSRVQISRGRSGKVNKKNKSIQNGTNCLKIAYTCGVSIGTWILRLFANLLLILKSFRLKILPDKFGDFILGFSFARLHDFLDYFLEIILLRKLCGGVSPNIPIDFVCF